MYVGVVPKDMERFEKENEISFLSLFKPSLYNAAMLVCLIRQCSMDEAKKYVIGVIEKSSLADFYKKVVEEFTKLGFLSKSDGKPITDFTELPMWSDIWYSNLANAMKIGYSATDYDNVRPAVTVEVCTYKVQEIKDKMNHELFIVWLTAQLVALGFNDPKKFPKKPYTVEKQKPPVQTPQERAQALMEFKATLSINSGKSK